ncbi:deoxyribose-phosphate aldolase [Eubacterium barkeri]|uniref:Deoxyribose-phosphate aldolase n=1 Tax=Eubacterium barkeri TaxID=1528 RepID=A0A1H3JN97_EUBBA|nr:deoxyribose-phosphate aldolase [Eubacterium barkeri]SDY40848.1 deoxyribose-phosphate aldolase [Eubacterium barkeri]
MNKLTVEELAKLIDHTNLKPYASEEDMEKLCEEAKEYGFKMVAINQTQSKRCSEFLKGTEVHTGAAISFPLGQTSIESKVSETRDAIQNGADEIDYVINLTEVKNGNFDYIQSEMQAIVDVCREREICIKVIFENCYLTKDEIKKIAEIAKVVKPNFIKTSTGFGTGGATLEDVRLMKSIVGDSVKVKAAGGIRSLADALAFVEAGAERLGTSAGIAIIEEYKTTENA